MARTPYPSDLTDEQWQLVGRLIPPALPGGRPRTVDMHEIVKRSDDVKGFKVLPKRWIVERTFGWLGRYRRHSKDYEQLTDSSEAMIRISMINQMIHRLKPG